MLHKCRRPAQGSGGSRRLSNRIGRGRHMSARRPRSGFNPGSVDTVSSRCRTSKADLDALATDAGTQLRAFELTEQRARELARALAEEITAEWSRFRGQDVRN
jgi:hypothetical protein